MGEALVPFQSGLPEGREESLTRQFYQWEKRGRGWQLCSYPVELEPPFRPLIIFETGLGTVADDGRIHSFWSRIRSNEQPEKARSGPTASEYMRQIAELDEPLVCQYDNDDFHELQIILPRDLRITKSISDRLLLSATYCTNPIAFELVGTEDEVTVQMAATDRDVDQLTEQLTAHLPDAIVRRTDGNVLHATWESRFGSTLIADFGLSNEFIIPLNTISNLEADPLVSVVGALSHLRPGETGVLQVLFQRTRNDWATEILDSVQFLDGTPFFSNAPEFISHAKRKVMSPIYAVVLRTAVKCEDRARAIKLVRSLGSGLSLLASPSGNELIPLSNDDYDDDYHEVALLYRQTFRPGMLLNLDELVSIVHPPTLSVRSEKLVRESEHTKAAPRLVIGNELILGKNVHGDESV